MKEEIQRQLEILHLKIEKTEKRLTKKIKKLHAKIEEIKKDDPKKP